MQKLLTIGIISQVWIHMALADILVGPFSDAGRYQLVANGGFEAPEGIAPWLQFSSFTLLGRVATTNRMSQAGDKSLQTTAVMVGSSPHRFGCQQDLSVVPGATYVVSVFAHTGSVKGQLALDVFTQGDTRVPVPLSSGDNLSFVSGIPAWQFGSATFTAPEGVNRVFVRLMHSNLTALGEAGYWDNLAVTPRAEFEPPTPVLSALASITVGNYAGIAIEGTLGRRYRVERALSLTSPHWEVVTNFYLPQTPYFLIDPAPGDGRPRFYRALPE